MKKRKHLIHSEQFLAQLLKNEAVRKRYQENYEALLIAYYIVSLRKSAHMTQAELAKKLQTTQSAVARIENGKQNTTIQTLVKIARIFGRKLTIKFH